VRKVPVGPIVSQHDVTMGLRDDDLVEAVIVIAKIVEPDGDVRLHCGYTPGTSWLERVGMLRAAERAELPESREWRDDD
jgi:hypothetical protein